jgi:peptidoglycan/xylan/chitin deacetylase (PgdA/CDA1 family)
MNDCIVQYYRCPENFVRLRLREPLSKTSGYFKFGSSTTCYGRCSGHLPSSSPTATLRDAFHDITLDANTVCLPFDLDEVVDNLRYELYSQESSAGVDNKSIGRAYYLLRPLLSVAFRRHIQRWYLRGWDRLPFPQWPVDRTVERIFELVMLLSLETQSVDQIPFIWFWPEGASSCAMITHDVETMNGVLACPYVMDTEDKLAIKGSFQIIPEERYEVTDSLLDSIRQRGFEVGVHDLNHDGHLFWDRGQFLQRARKINSYKVRFGASGFRSAVLYRKQLWFDALNFSYDMSVPNVAHLDPQRGGCCTVMPYFVGKILELPLTTTQDYMLFHILNRESIDLWKDQIDLIMEKHGLISFNIHPDYLDSPSKRTVFEALLEYLAGLREEKGVWITNPGEVDRWWRQRAEMKLVRDGLDWRVEGPGSERACVAYIGRNNGAISYTCVPAFLECGRSPNR